MGVEAVSGGTFGCDEEARVVSDETTEAVDALRALVSAAWEHDQKWAAASPEMAQAGLVVAWYEGRTYGDDPTNALMRRCMAVVDLCHAVDRFVTECTLTRSDPRDTAVAWRAGFYERGFGHHIATGPTLRAALENWLADYEGVLPSDGGWE
jgi:hypothetical protein